MADHPPLPPSLRSHQPIDCSEWQVSRTALQHLLPSTRRRDTACAVVQGLRAHAGVQVRINPAGAVLQGLLTHVSVQVRRPSIGMQPMPKRKTWTFNLLNTSETKPASDLMYFGLCDNLSQQFIAMTILTIIIIFKLMDFLNYQSLYTIDTVSCVHFFFLTD